MRPMWQTRPQSQSPLRKGMFDFFVDSIVLILPISRSTLFIITGYINFFIVVIIQVLLILNTKMKAIARAKRAWSNKTF